MKMKNILPLKKVHFIGIGGIGMSAIAEMLDELGIAVQGSDAVQSANTDRLKRGGIQVFIGHDKNNLDGVDSVVVSTATPENNVELLEAKRRGIPVGHRSEMLAEILRFKQSICVSGTHGKTTTSSLIASILMQARLRPSFVIGGILNSERSNARLGRGRWVVAEADESDGSFLKLPTTISVVTNIDAEHMNFYKTYDNMKNAYRVFMNNTSFYGACVACIDHPVVAELAAQIAGRKIITYGLNKTADVHADHIRTQKGRLIFDVFVRTGAKFKKMKDVELKMFGKHNVQNALAAIAAALQAGVHEDAIKKALKNFEGIGRRLTKRGTVGGIDFYDDYAHHPVEIAATLSAVKESMSADEKVIAIFQPHRYSRFQDLWRDFLGAFKDADAVIVTDVYAGGEKPVPGVNKEAFVQELEAVHPHVFAINDFNELEGLLKRLAKAGDSVVALGAGDISKKITQFVKGRVG